MTTLGLIFLTAAVAAVWRFGRNALPWLLSAAIALPSSVALVAGGNGLVPFYAIAPFALAATVLALLRRQKGSQSGREQLGCTALCLFVAWTLVITALGPTVFAGVSVLRPRGGIDNEIASPSRLDYTISHVAQIAYLLLGVSVVFFLAQRGRLSPALPAAGFGLGTGLSSLVLLAEQVGLPWPANLLSNSPNLRYIDYTQQLEPRFRGVFVEPAALAAFSIAAMAFFVSFIAQSRGRARVWSAGGGALCGVNLIASGAGTALVGGLIVVLVAVAIGVYRFLAGATRWPVRTVMAACAAFLPFLVIAPIFYNGSVEIAKDKLVSDSLSVRTGSNLFSLNLAIETYGIGVGLGSHRPSSLYLMLLTCVGVVGLTLFLAAVLTIVRQAWRVPAARPAAWGMVAILLTRLVGGPDLSTPMFWLCLGVCAHAAWRTPGAWLGVVGDLHQSLARSSSCPQLLSCPPTDQRARKGRTPADSG